MSRPNTHPAPITKHRRKAIRRRLESLLSDSRGWPQEAAPLRVRARVMSNLAAQRQASQADGRSIQSVTMYRPRRTSGRRLEFSMRPPLAAAAVIAMIVSAAVHFMGGTEAWQPWADGLANRFYDVEHGGHRLGGPAFANADPVREGSDAGRDEAEALFTDVARFRAHLSGRIPMAEPTRAPPQTAPTQSPPSRSPSSPDSSPSS